MGKLKIAAILFSLVIISCNKVDDIDTNTSLTSSDAFTLCFTPDSSFDVSAIETRATTETVIEDGIENIWLLFFDEEKNRINPTTDEERYYNGSARQGTTQEDEIYGSTYIADYKSEQIIYVNKELSAKIRYIRAVGNSNDPDNPNFIEANCKTLESYREKYFRLEDNAYRESDMWVEHEIEGKTICYLRLAGSWDGVIPDTGLDFNIGILAKPIAAKVTMSYVCNDYYEDGTLAAWVDVSSVQITRVPQNCYYKDVENSSAHDHEDYTSYQPRLTYVEDYIGTKSGAVSFYVPQNLAGTNKENQTASDKTLNHVQDATCVIITGTYTHYNSETRAWEEDKIYIQLYPGEDITDYNVKLRREYHMVCTITAKADAATWDTDYRVTLDEVLPEGAIVHYEFNTEDLTYNSAYDASGNLLGGYPRTDGSYMEILDTKRTSYNSGEWTDQSVYTIDGLDCDEYYHRWIYGFAGTNNIITTDERPFLRNLAQHNYDYDNSNWTKTAYPPKNHPEIFDCTFVKDNYGRYGSDYTDRVMSTYQYDSGVLQYYPTNNYINSSMLQLMTGWGTELDPSDEETVFTIVFIGSVGENNEQGVDSNTGVNESRGVYYGNSIEWNSRWYFYRYDCKTASLGVENGVTFGFADQQTEAIDALTATPYQNVQAYDICSGGYRKIYYNNVDVEKLEIPKSSTYKYKGSDTGSGMYGARPTVYEYILDAPTSIFGHTTVNNYDDAIDAKLRLFLIYDRALDLDEIDQIRRYAALKGLLLYGEGDYDTFDITVDAQLETAYDSDSPTINADWDNGGGDDAEIGGSN